ncbi:MAG: type III-A CRISPR-associated protein Csm2 [bacterium]|nr:type III-A CRISPR-associated protein Csm2 [bacterium]
MNHNRFAKDRQGDKGNNQPKSSFPEIEEKIKQLSSFKDLSANELVKFSEKVGSALAKSLKISQLRKFLDTIRTYEATYKRDKSKFTPDDVILLKPKLAYTARKDEAKPLMSVLDPAIDKIKTYADFERFVKFVEGIVAYHRYNDGQD